MSTPESAVSLTGLPGRLVLNGVFTDEDITDIQANASKSKTSFFTAAIAKKPRESLSISRHAADEYGLPLLDIKAFDTETLPSDILDDKQVRKHNALPLMKRGNKVFLAVSDPTNLTTLDEIRFSIGSAIEAIVVDPITLEKVIERWLDKEDSTLKDLADTELDDIDIGGDEGPAEGEEDTQADTPVVRYVTKVILDAVNRGASDIHFEPYEQEFRIRYRIDGVLSEINSPPLTLAQRIAARIKILSRLDIAERRAPQDGRMKMRLSKKRSIDFRVSTLPTMHGEKVVIRVLDPTATEVGVENLGFDPNQRDLFLDAINRPYGMILVTGPTGSGKTVTLYTALRMLNDDEKNLSTIEDPVEINLTGVNQVQINLKAGVDFAVALRAFLRQDPDIIMVGEIRDLETAEIAVKASQTGHLVLSTLHTNDAPSTLTRLMNMGVPPFNIASSVHLIIAQRLARRLCASCKIHVEYPENALLDVGFEKGVIRDLSLYGPHPEGCEHCTRGYKGRLGVFQLLPVSSNMAEMIMRGCTESEIEQLAHQEGYLNLRESGLRKVEQGQTSLEEIERVTNL